VTDGAERPSGEFLGPVLRALAESLDVREIFSRISEEARRVVPHDFLMLGLVSEARQSVRVMALSDGAGEAASEIVVPEPLRFLIDGGTFVLNEMQPRGDGASYGAWLRRDGTASREPIEILRQPLFDQLVIVRGFRSFLRVPVTLRGGAAGGLVFCSGDPGAYPPADVGPARQIADCVALAVAHQRLAEEERRGAEARARAERLERRVQDLTEELEAQGRHRVLGQSREWREVLDQAGKVARTEATVLLTGESGTGKEVVARFIHRASARSGGPFVALNCAALPEHLLESELFGHEKGAFTGAVAARPGRIEQASSGVLFLDEVAEMSPAVQAKFLRVLQEKEYQRLGGTRTLGADVRVLAATNRDLRTAIARGAFREDLYYRLAVFDIALPPLRERPADIPPLLEAFMEEIGRSMGRPASGISDDARRRLMTYAWPGNVRELRNTVERALILCEGGTIATEHLPLGVASAAEAGVPAPATAGRTHGGAGSLHAAEREMILQALARAGNNKSKAARLLGLTRAQLRSRIEKHGIVPQD